MAPSGSSQRLSVSLHPANRIADLGHGVESRFDRHGFGRIPASLNRTEALVWALAGSRRVELYGNIIIKPNFYTHT